MSLNLLNANIIRNVSLINHHIHNMEQYYISGKIAFVFLYFTSVQSIMLFQWALCSNKRTLNGLSLSVTDLQLFRLSYFFPCKQRHFGAYFDITLTTIGKNL